MMRFCQKCKVLMRPKKEKNKIYLVCPKCGKTEQIKEKIVISTHLEKKEESKIIKSFEAEESLPKINAICPKCGNNEAYWWTQQTRSADEPPTEFYKCTKCGYQWRSYG